MNENKEILAIILSIGGGIFSILASIFNWNFFFENRKAAIFMKLFGRNGSRVFYSIIGLALLFFAYKIISK